MAVGTQSSQAPAPSCADPTLGIPQPCLPVAEWGAGSGGNSLPPAFTYLTLSSRCAQVWTPAPRPALTSSPFPMM